MKRLPWLALAAVWTAVGPPVRAAYVPSAVKPPAPAREFRGLWVATVKNIDWPSQAGLTTAQQQAELRTLLDRAVALKLNAVIFQVRPACDALYASKLEPWSEFLTGRMGQAPQPYYDPLAFAIEEAHQRGLELHAWFNPFRARFAAASSPIARNHISQTRPSLVLRYGSQWWLDPGQAAVRQHSLAVILDVLRRYNVDGIHLDDYFYPYPENLAKGGLRAFPDDASWRHYGTVGGKLERSDWRRSNVDAFVQQLYRGIKAEKPRVKFGLSPFGIWRPGQPAPIKGFDAFALLYADARKWLQEGWLDYFAPQLYWAIGAREQSFPVLLEWWAAQNRHQRHLWPGLSLYRHSPEEIHNQIVRTRTQTTAQGNLLWGAKLLVPSANKTAITLQKNTYAQPALVPAFPWLDPQPPGPPKLFVSADARFGLKLSWEPTGTEAAWLWLVQTQSGTAWTARVLSGRETSVVLPGTSPPERLAVRAVDRCGNLSGPTVVQRSRP